MGTTLEGQTLGKYRILEALGRGGMAQVYRAYHPQLERYVAVKVLRADLVEQEEFLARFRREAHAVSGLRHANIVQVFDFDVQDDLYYMVMELLEGDTLRARLSNYRGQGQRMPLPEVLRVTADVLTGLEHAHGEGIIHRDIKPANIMLTKKGQAVLTDFGIAQIVGATQVTASGALMGTLSYMAPEQGLKGATDVRSDIYSLGIVLYEMLTGYTPFDADTPLAILMKHLNDPLPLPSHVDPHIPPALEEIVLKALAKDPADRYQTAAEMLAALQGLDVSEGARPLVPLQAVFSGKARQHIKDGGFAQGDTDPDVQLPAPGGAPDSPDPAPAPVVMGVVQRPISPVTAVFGAMAAYLVFNMVAVMGETLANADIFARAWPFEVLLAAALFGLLAWATQTVWMFIPGLMALGNAILLSYASLTARWDDWLFLWMLIPLVVWGAIALPIWIEKMPGRSHAWARDGGALLGLGSMALAALVITLAFFIK